MAERPALRLGRRRFDSGQRGNLCRAGVRKGRLIAAATAILLLAACNEDELAQAPASAPAASPPGQETVRQEAAGIGHASGPAPAPASIAEGLGHGAGTSLPAIEALPGVPGKTISVLDASAPPAFGVQFHGTWNMYYSPPSSGRANAMFYRHLDALEKYRVKLLRIDIGWSASQPDPGTPSMRNTYNRRIDTVLTAARQRGMKVLITLHQSPAWSRPGTGSRVKQYPADPDSIRPWATWLGRTFGSRVAAWEVWNEPNLEEFTAIETVAERPRRYVPILQAAATGLRAGDPHATVVFGAPSQTDDAFITACYALGAKPYFDVMAVHPYQGDQTKPPEAEDISGKSRMTNFPAVIAAMAAHGDGRKPVWWTEFGYSVHSNTDVSRDDRWLRGVQDPQTSGEYLRRAFELARVRYPQVRVAVVYAAYNQPDGLYGHKYGYRLLDADGEERGQLPIIEGYLARFSQERTF
jgi:hypothetical protein